MRARSFCSICSRAFTWQECLRSAGAKPRTLLGALRPWPWEGGGGLQLDPPSLVVGPIISRRQSQRRPVRNDGIINNEASTCKKVSLTAENILGAHTSHKLVVWRYLCCDKPARVHGTSPATNSVVLYSLALSALVQRARSLNRPWSICTSLLFCNVMYGLGSSLFMHAVISTRACKNAACRDAALSCPRSQACRDSSTPSAHYLQAIHHPAVHAQDGDSQCPGNAVRACRQRGSVGYLPAAFGHQDPRHSTVSTQMCPTDR